MAFFKLLHFIKRKYFDVIFRTQCAQTSILQDFEFDFTVFRMFPTLHALPCNGPFLCLNLLTEAVSQDKYINAGEEPFHSKSHAPTLKAFVKGRD